MSANANRRCFLLFSSAVRFGRIPKREKQRLLDEMQSYMNSLNESASMEMEVSPPPDAPCSPQNQTNEGAGSMSQSYRSNLMNRDQKPLKMAAGNGNIGASSFQNSSVQQPSLSHSATQTHHTVHGEQASYHIPTSCPVSSTNNENSTVIDDAKYTFSSNQNQCPVSGRLSSKSYSANQNSYPASDSQNQSPCPWTLNGGAKVLVRLSFPHIVYVNICQYNANTMSITLPFFSAGMSTQFLSSGSGQSLQSGGVGVFLPMLHPCC